MITRRKKLLGALLMAIITSVFLLTCSSSAKLPRLSNDAVILAFGDSLTFGTGAKPTESYPAILEQLVGRQVDSSGVPGEVTAEGVSRLQGVMERGKPALMIICHGGNDLLRHMDQKQAADNIRAMVRLAKERGVAVVLIAVPSPNITLSPPSFYREIAAEMGFPIEEHILTTVLAKGSLRSDSIHPNAAGYRKIAEAIAALLKKSGAVE